MKYLLDSTKVPFILSHTHHAPSFPVHCPSPVNGPGMPLLDLTSATTLTKADPAPASHALTNTGVTSQDAQQLTLGKSTLKSHATKRTDLNHLQALAIPPEDTPKYLSQLTPPTTIDINNLASFLQGHPDPTLLNHLLTGFSQGFKIGYSGPRAPKEYSNLPLCKFEPIYH